MPSAQTWDPDTYAKNARFVADLGAPVVELLAPRPGQRILDLGCGDGVLTQKLAALGCEVVGVDASEALVRRAREVGVDARVMDGEALDFDAGFDAVFSNAALHWMKAADRVLAGVYRALLPGGRFVAELGGQGCVQTLHRALMAALDARGYDGRAASPWYFPDTEEYGARLVAAGFQIESIALMPRPTPLPGDVMGWLQTFAESFTRVLPEAERRSYLEDVREATRPHLCDATGAWTADYVRLRFAARKPDAAR
ncbi:MAG TPA: methyltransferase domain-containing protein [Polyangiaceae bacterium]|nr:methyltransferase domain-containing protein [Polyangiaceae bacterium]